MGPTDGGLPRDPRPRGWRGRFGGLPSLGTQVEGLLELFFFYFTLQIWGMGFDRGSAGVALSRVEGFELCCEMEDIFAC